MKKIIILSLALISTFSTFGLNNANAGFFDNKEVKSVNTELNLNTMNKVSYLNSIIEDFCTTNKCNLSVESKKSDDYRTVSDVSIKGTREDLALFEKNKEIIKSKIQEIENNNKYNTLAFFNNLTQKEVEKENANKKITTWVIFASILVLIIFLAANIGLPTPVLISSIALGLIISLIYINSLPEPNYIEIKEGNGSDKVLTYTMIDYLDDVNGISEDELRERKRLDSYYEDILVGDSNGNTIKANSIPNDRKLKLRNEILNKYNTIFKDEDVTISFHESSIGLITRIHKSPWKEKLVTIGTIAVGIGLIYAKHKVSSKMFGNDPYLKSLNNISTIGMASSMMVALQTDMKDVYIP